MKGPRWITAAEVDTEVIISQASVTLTDAQIRTLPTIPIQIVEAQGENTILVPLFAFMHLDWGADYTNIGDTGRIGIEYAGQSSSTLASLLEAVGEVSNLLQDGASHPAFLPPRANVQVTGGSVDVTSGIGQFIDDPGTINTALNIYATNTGSHTGNYVGGTGTSMKVTVYYMVVTL